MTVLGKKFAFSMGLRIALSLLCCGVGIFVLSACSARQQENLSSAKGMETGESLFQANCYGCHSPAGRLDMNRLSHESPKLKDEHTFIAYLRHPYPGMPAFREDQLNAEQAHQIYLYIRQMAKKNS